MINLMISIPLYGGSLRGECHSSLLQLQSALTKKGIGHKFSYRYDESLVTRARNKLAYAFTRSASTHQLLIDSDIAFRASDVMDMIEWSAKCPGIIGGPYAKKGTDWARIARISGSPNEFPITSMPKMGAKIVANFINPNILLSEPCEVRHLGTGYMLIPRYVYEALDQNPNVLSYKVNEEEVLELGTDRLKAYFEAKVYDDQYPSEDWYFCDRYRETGGKVWLCPWMTTEHIGHHAYPIDIPMLAATGEEL